MWKVTSSMITNTEGVMARFDPLTLYDTLEMTPLERLPLIMSYSEPISDPSHEGIAGKHLGSSLGIC